VQVISVFALLGSDRSKAAHKTLAKSGFINVKCYVNLRLHISSKEVSQVFESKEFTADLKQISHS